MPKMTKQELEMYVWEAATILRGKTPCQDYKGHIVTLFFFKWISDQWEYEAAKGQVHRFELPEGTHWRDVSQATENLGGLLNSATRAISKANPDLTGVFTVDWNQTALDGSGKLIAHVLLQTLIQHFNGKNLSNAAVEVQVLRRAYEYLIEMFADQGGPDANIAEFSLDFIAGRRRKPSVNQCIREEINWQTYAMAKVHTVLHRLESMPT